MQHARQFRAFGSRIFDTFCNSCVFHLQVARYRPVLKYQNQFFGCRQFVLVKQIHTGDVLKRKASKGYYSKVFVDFHDEIKEKPDFSMTISEWENFVTEVTNESPEAIQTFEFSMMKAANSQQKADLAKSLMEYIKSKGPPNLSTQMMFVSAVGEKYEDLALKEFYDIEKTYGIDSPVRQEVLMAGIAKTKEWRKSVSMLEHGLKEGVIKLNEQFKAIVIVLEAALRNGDFKTFYEVLLKTEGFLISHVIPEVIFKTCMKMRYPPDVLLELLKIDHVSISHEQAQELEIFCKKSWSPQVQCHATKVVRSSGICRKCREKLKVGNSLTRAETDLLAHKLLNKVVLQSNIYISTTPKEKEDFTMFMSKYGPFDFVLDGLNIIFQQKNQHLKRDTILSEVIGLLHKKYGEDSRVLVMMRHSGADQGRQTTSTQHMGIKRFDKNAYILYLDAKSKDDGFMLLAAFLSGPQCYMVSNDAFKDHNHKMNSEDMKALFLKWQFNRQLALDIKRSSRQAPKYELVDSGNYGAQETEAGWHIPYRYPDFQQLSAHNLTFIQTDAYLCVKKLDYKPSKELLAVREIKKNVYDRHKEEKKHVAA